MASLSFSFFSDCCTQPTPPKDYPKKEASRSASSNLLPYAGNEVILEALTAKDECNQAKYMKTLKAKMAAEGKSTNETLSSSRPK